MPGIGLFLDNGSFLRVFQVIDGIIQRKQPVFVSIWVGSVIALLVAAGLGWGELDGSQPAWIDSCLHGRAGDNLHFQCAT